MKRVNQMEQQQRQQQRASNLTCVLLTFAIVILSQCGDGKGQKKTFSTLCECGAGEYGEDVQNSGYPTRRALS